MIKRYHWIGLRAHAYVEARWTPEMGMIKQEEDGSYVVQASSKKPHLEYKFAVVRGRIYTLKKGRGGDERDEREARTQLKHFLSTTPPTTANGQ